MPTAGSGKTFLTTFLIDHVFQNLQGKVATLTYFFCDFHDPRSLEIRTIIGSLIKQAVSLTNSLPSTLQKELESAYLTPQYTPTLATLFGLLESLIQLPDITYIVIDGLDECCKNDRYRLLTFFIGLITSQNQRVKIILSSRPEIDIMKSVSGFYQISLEDVKNRPDIEAYIDDEIHQKWETGRISLSIMKEIKEALIKGAEGM